MRLVLLILSVSLCAAAQDADQQQTTAPAPAFGQSAPVLNPENPPLAGIGEPGLSLKTASRSFVSPAIQVGESADTNENDQLGSSKWNPPMCWGRWTCKSSGPKATCFWNTWAAVRFRSSPHKRSTASGDGL